MAFTLTSPAFRDGETIPVRFTCEGDDEQPPLAWSHPPEGTRSFALVMDDPDAPAGSFTHWLLHDIPAAATAILPGESLGTSLVTSFHRRGYGGPCPPPGHPPHRYVFALHALDVDHLDVHGTGREALDRALRPHTLAVARLTGSYQSGRQGGRPRAAARPGGG
jgi:Raf kinase inhibitor-like YbhB/YbcL family protein